MDKLPITLIVTPTLGESEYLDKTVEGVANLKLPIRHVLSVPARKIEAIKSRYPNLEVVPDAGKEGAIYGALNAALKSQPDGWDWFTYINDDDLLLPAFGEMAREHFGRADPEPVAYGNVSLIDDFGRLIGDITVEKSPAWIPALLQEGISPLMQQGMLFHRETVRRLGAFDQRYRLCADLDFWSRAYAAGERFRYYPKPIAQFRLRLGQLSGNTSLTEKEQTEIVARHFPDSISSVKRKIARIRYRAINLPRYVKRFCTRGVKTSYELLENKA